MFARGTVVDIEHNSGEFDGKPWATRHVVLSTGERVKLHKEMDAPDEGDVVECLVTLSMRAQPNNLLEPYRVNLLARDWSRVNSSPSVAAVPAPRGRVAAAK